MAPKLNPTLATPTDRTQRVSAAISAVAWLALLCAGFVAHAVAVHMGWLRMPPSGAELTFSPWRLLTLLVLAPVLEEYVFRGHLQPYLFAKIGLRLPWQNHAVAIALTSIAFAGVHLLTQAPAMAAWLLLPSIAFGLQRSLSPNFWPSAALHSAYNGLWVAGQIGWVMAW